MKYLGTKDIEKIELNWSELIDEVFKATSILKEGDFSQPIKPYLRYKNPANRIIAMPAYLGKEVGVAGIKWIASFPGNIDKGIKRAHSTIILNEEETGFPFAILNTALVSGIRTASVTGAVLRKYVQDKETLGKNLTVGLIGLGPIGILHLKMIEAIIGDRVKEYLVYDIRKEVAEKLDLDFSHKIKALSAWEETFDNADIYCTCTVSKAPYIDRKPKEGSLQLNVSLRDYKPGFMDYVSSMLVDDWDEVCREKTDIEAMHLEKGLNREDSIEIKDYLFPNGTKKKGEGVVMFNPMGLAIYDLAISKYLYEIANKLNIGTELED
jgi:ornithine cyclodeaminase